MSNYGQEDFFPTDKIYQILGKNTSASHENIHWYEDLKACLEMLNEKLGSPRLTNLHELWSSGFKDLELKKLEHSLLTVQIVLDDIDREGKELRLWKVQHRHLKDLFCKAGDILDDIALRAPHLKVLFQSPQVPSHPYLTDKLLQINNLIQELNNLAEEIKSKVLPEFNIRRRKEPGANDTSMYDSAQGSISDRRNEVQVQTNEKIIPEDASIGTLINLINSMAEEFRSRLDGLTVMTTQLTLNVMLLHQRFDKLQTSAVEELSSDHKYEEDTLDDEGDENLAPGNTLKHPKFAELH